ncbi:FtsW/RodA/SpoVE family cell cycle protein [Niallia sp. JL1B1071]|uniref:FtsW/RodA/SpoVE family cell cycle protein n=1 Tax=Niallia tiangongensis TaxID=3237105 RepID=UPI0037DDE1FF
MLFWSNFSKKKVLLTLGTGISIFLLINAYIYITRGNYRLKRLMAFFFPERYGDDAGWYYLFLDKMWASLRWIGPSDSDALFYVNYTDTVFLQLSYQFGYVMAGILAVLFGALIIKMFSNVNKIKNPYAKLLIIGATALYSVQVIYNIGMCVGLLPSTSLSLPFISYGIVPTIINALLIGLILSIIRRKNFQ